MCHIRRRVEDKREEIRQNALPRLFGAAVFRHKVPVCRSAYSTVCALRVFVYKAVLSAFEQIDRYSDGSAE